VAIYATGTFTAVFGLWPAPKAVAAAMLLPGMALAPQQVTGADQHPLVFMLGREWGVTVHSGPFRLDDRAYLEFLLAVPFVERAPGEAPWPGPFVFMPRLFLDSWLFVVAGWFYGYPKRRARVRSSNSNYDIASLVAGTPLLAASFSDRGPWGSLADYPNASRTTPVFHLPFMGPGLLGSFIYSHLIFHMERARIQPVSLDIRIANSFAHGVPVAEHHFPGVDESPYGAYRIEVPWTLGPPSWAGHGEKAARS
jgi:hypothetical protein